MISDLRMPRRWLARAVAAVIALVGVAAAAFAGGCAQSGPDVATADQALVSHGPTACVGSPPPDWNLADIYSAPNYNGVCERWRGDMNIGSAHVGYVITPSFPARSIKISTTYRPTAGLSTSATVCQGPATGPSYAPCSANGLGVIFMNSANTNTAAFFPWTPKAVVLGSTPYCMPTADWYAQQSGQALPYPRPPANDAYPAALTWTACGYTYDGSGLPAYMATDAFGHPIFLPTASGANGECILDPAQPPIAPGAPAGKVVAVYAC